MSWKARWVPLFATISACTRSESSSSDDSSTTAPIPVRSSCFDRWRSHRGHSCGSRGRRSHNRFVRRRSSSRRSGTCPSTRLRSTISTQRPLRIRNRTVPELRDQQPRHLTVSGV